MPIRGTGRRLALIPFEENTQKSVDLPRDRLIKSINLDFSATLVLAAGTTSGTISEDAVLLIMPKIEVIGDGVRVLFRKDAQALYWENTLEAGATGVLTNPTTGDAGSETIACNFTINFQNNLGIIPADTYLPAHMFRTLQLIIDWGELDDMFSGANDRTKTIATSFGVRPVVYETNQPAPNKIRIQDFIEKEIASTQSDFSVDLLAEVNRVYQKFLFKTLDAGVRDNDVINTIDLITGEEFYHQQKIPYDQLRNQNKTDLHLETMPAGFAYLYLLEDQRFVSGLNVSDVKSAKLSLDVTVGGGTTMLRVYTDMIVPLTSA